MGADLLLAWPNAEISFMAPSVAANVLLGRKLDHAPDPMAARQAFMAELSQQNAPWEAAERNFIDRIIDPRQTRAELIRALAVAGSGFSKRNMAGWPKP